MTPWMWAIPWSLGWAGPAAEPVETAIGPIPRRTLSSLCAAPRVWIGTVVGSEPGLVLQPHPSFPTNRPVARLTFAVDASIAGDVGAHVTADVPVGTTDSDGLPRSEIGGRYLVGQVPTRDGGWGWGAVAELDAHRDLPSSEGLAREVTGWTSELCVCHGSTLDPYRRAE